MLLGWISMKTSTVSKTPSEKSLENAISLGRKIISKIGLIDVDLHADSKTIYIYRFKVMPSMTSDLLT